MNNLLETVWREYPHLIANKSFNMVYKGNKYLICGFTVTNMEDGFPSPYGLHAYKNNERFTAFVQDCTLLTRSIDSLTDEEMYKIFELCGHGVRSTEWISDWRLPENDFGGYVKEQATKNTNLYLYLLSIGIWIGSKEGVEVVE